MSEKIIISNNIQSSKSHIDKLTKKIYNISNEITNIDTEINNIEQTLNPETGVLNINEINIKQGTIDNVNISDEDNRIVNKKYVDDLIGHSGEFNPELQIDFKNNRSITTKGTVEVGVDDTAENPHIILKPNGNITTESITINNTTISTNDNNELTINNKLNVDNTINSNRIETTSGIVNEIKTEDGDYAIVNKKYVDEHGGSVDPNVRLDLKAVDFSLSTKGGILIGVDDEQINEKAFITKDGQMNIMNGYVINVDTTSSNKDYSIVNKNYIDGEITTLNNRLTTAEGNISNNSSNISGLNNRLTTAEGNISNNSTNISGLNNRLTTAEGNISNNSINISGLNTRLTAAEGNITNNSTNISGLSTRLTAAEGNITNNSTNISGLNNRLTTAEGNISNNSSDISGLSTRLTAAEGNITNNSTAIENINAQLSSIGQSFYVTEIKHEIPTTHTAGIDDIIFTFINNKYTLMEWKTEPSPEGYKVKNVPNSTTCIVKDDATYIKESNSGDIQEWIKNAFKSGDTLYLTNTNDALISSGNIKLIDTYSNVKAIINKTTGNIETKGNIVVSDNSNNTKASIESDGTITTISDIKVVDSSSNVKAIINNTTGNIETEGYIQSKGDIKIVDSSSNVKASINSNGNIETNGNIKINTGNIFVGQENDPNLLIESDGSITTKGDITSLSSVNIGDTNNDIISITAPTTQKNYSNITSTNTNGINVDSDINMNDSKLKINNSTKLIEIYNDTTNKSILKTNDDISIYKGTGESIGNNNGITIDDNGVNIQGVTNINNTLNIKNGNDTKITLDNVGNIIGKQFNTNGTSNPFAVNDSTDNTKTKLLNISSLTLPSTTSGNTEITSIISGNSGSNNDKLATQGYVDEHSGGGGSFDPSVPITLYGEGTSLTVNNDTLLKGNVIFTNKIQLQNNPTSIDIITKDDTINTKVNINNINSISTTSISLTSGTITTILNDDNAIVNKSYVDDNNVGKHYENSTNGEIFNSYDDNYKNSASGIYSHAEGYYTAAEGEYSHAEGYHTIAHGKKSHAEGYNTTASGDYSHAEGNNTTASGEYSHAEGDSSKAEGNRSHAEGSGCTASGNYSHAGGNFTSADQECMTAIGTYNTKNNTNTLFVVGNGTADDARSDAFVVKNDGSISAQKLLITKVESDQKYLHLYSYYATGASVSSFVIRADLGLYLYTGDHPTLLGQENAGLHLVNNNVNIKGNVRIYNNLGTSTDVIEDDLLKITPATLTEPFIVSSANKDIKFIHPTITLNGKIQEGQNTTATGSYAHAEGNDTTASGYCSHAEGNNTTASVNCSHAEGYNTNALEECSHAEGDTTTASGVYSHAEGSYTTASGVCSHAGGDSTTADQECMTAIGKLNTIENTGALFVVGNGTADNARSDAFVIKNDGSAYIQTKLNVNNNDIIIPDTIDNTKVNINNINSISTTSISLTSGTISTTPNNDNAIVNKKYVDDNNVGKHYENSTNGEIFNNYSNTNKNTASGDYSHAEGYHTTATGDYSHAEGQNTTASGDWSHAEGNNTTASGYCSHAEGHNTTASNNWSHAEGQNTTASGIRSHAEGYGTNATSNYSHAEGNETEASASAAHAEGGTLIKDSTTYYTKATATNSHAEGGGTTASGEESHAEGYITSASGEDAHAEGAYTIASGVDSHAGGKYTVADQPQMTAIGKYNVYNSSQLTLNDGKLFVVGNGTAENARSDAFVVKDDGSISAQTSLYVNNTKVYPPTTAKSSNKSNNTYESFISFYDNNNCIYSLVLSDNKYIIYKYYGYDGKNKLIEISKDDYPLINNIYVFNEQLILLTSTGLYYINLSLEELTISLLLEDTNINKLVIDPRNDINKLYVLYNSYDYYSIYTYENNEFNKVDNHIFTNENNYLPDELNILNMIFYENNICFIHTLYKNNEDKYIITYSSYDEINNTITKYQETNLLFTDEYQLVDTYIYQNYIYILMSLNGSEIKLIKIQINDINNYYVYDNIIDDNLTKYNQNIYYNYNSNYLYIVSNNYIYKYELYDNLIQLENKLYANNCKYINNRHTIYFTDTNIFQLGQQSIINGDILLNGNIKSSALNATQLNVSNVDVNVNKTIIHNTLIDGEIENYQVGEPVFVKGNQTYTLQRKSSGTKYPIYEYIEINDNNYMKNTINQIPMITNENNGKFIGIITAIYPKNTPLKINEITSNYIVINNNTIDFATHGDYIFKVDDNTALHQTTSGIDKVYEVGDEIMYDGRIIDPEQPLLRKYENMIVGKITYIPDNINYVSVFKY